MKISVLIFSILVAFLLTTVTFETSYAQKKRVVKVRKETEGSGAEGFHVGKGSKNYNGKVTRGGRRYSNRDEIKASVKKNRKQKKEIKKKQRNPNYVMDKLAWKDKSKETRAIKKEDRKQTSEMRKQAHKEKKSRKQTMRTNRQIKRELSVSGFHRFYANTWYATKQIFNFKFLKGKKHKGKSKGKKK